MACLVPHAQACPYVKRKGGCKDGARRTPLSSIAWSDGRAAGLCRTVRQSGGGTDARSSGRIVKRRCIVRPKFGLPAGLSGGAFGARVSPRASSRKPSLGQLTRTAPQHAPHVIQHCARFHANLTSLWLLDCAGGCTRPPWGSSVLSAAVFSGAFGSCPGALARPSLADLGADAGRDLALACMGVGP